MLVKPGPLVTNLAGSAAGLTLQRSRYGITGRGKPLPRNRRSSAQANVRGRMLSTVRAWQSLDPGYRDNWEALAATLTFTNRFGDPFTPTGYQAFCRQNFGNYSSQAGAFKFPFSEDIPASIDCTAPSAVEGTLHLSTGQVLLTSPDSVVEDDCRLQVFISPVVSAGRASHFGRWSWVATAAPADAFPLDITTGVEDVLGSLKDLAASRQVFALVIACSKDGWPRTRIMIRVQGVTP